MRNYPKTHLPQEPKKSTSQRNRRILVETEEDAFLVEEERQPTPVGALKD